MAGRHITVQFIGDDKSLKSAMGSIESSSGRLSSRLKSVAKVAGFALGAGMALAAKGLYDATKAAIADDAAQAKLAKTLKNNAGASAAQVAATEDWIAAQGRALGVTDDELRPALEKLVTATKDVGEAQKLASLAMDVSAGTGKSLESVSLALMKAQNGNISGLSRLGIATKDAEGNTLSFKDAVKRMGDQFGGQAATKAETLQGKMDRLKLIFDETKETIGLKLIPVLTRMADWFLNDGLPAMSQTYGFLKDKLGPTFALIGAVVGKATAMMRGDATKNLGVVAGIFREFATIARTIWGAIGDEIVMVVKGAFTLLRRVVSGALLVIRGIFRVVSGLLRGDWSKVWAGIKDIARGATRALVAIIKAALTLIRAVWRVAWTAVKGIFSTVWDGLKTAARNGVDRLGELILKLHNTFLSTLRSLPGKAISLGRDIIGGLLGGIRARASEVYSLLRDLAKNALKSAKDALGISSPSREFMKVGKDTAGGYIKGLAAMETDVSRTAARVMPESDATAATVTRRFSPLSVSAQPVPDAGGDVVLKVYLDGEQVHRSLVKRKRLIRQPLGLA